MEIVGRRLRRGLCVQRSTSFVIEEYDESSRDQRDAQRFYLSARQNSPTSRRVIAYRIRNFAPKSRLDDIFASKQQTNAEDNQLERVADAAADCNRNNQIVRKLRLAQLEGGRQRINVELRHFSQ